MPLSTTAIQTSFRWLTNVVEINRRVKGALERSSLSVTHYRILLELRMGGSHLTCSALAALLFVSPAAVTHACDYLTEHGFVTRKTMRSNRRVVLVGITPSGMDKLREADGELLTMLRRDAWCNLSADDLATLTRGCSAAVAPFVGRTLLHKEAAVEPSYITCAIIQQQSYETLLEPLGLTLTELRAALLTLASPEPLRSLDVSEALLLNRSSTARAVASLKRKGLLTSAVCPEDSRASILGLTAEGSAQCHQALERLVAFDQDVYCNENAPEPDALDVLSDKVYEALVASARRDRA